MKTTNTQAIRAVAICTAVALGFSAAGASAASSKSQLVSDGVNKYVVRFPDLDLSKIDGAATLYSRLSYAATVVCNSLHSRDLGIAARYRACVAQALANAVSNVNRPLVSQYHESRTRGIKGAYVQLAKGN
ncbi:MAG TPA: UrcA family protein [Steroidobacteraceae bacterium]|nr:UrcA family protein [Steroidobacteraceae bacterium]